MDSAALPLIHSVETDSPASRAGVLPGDLLMELNGHALHDIIDYQFHLEPGLNEALLEREGEHLRVAIDCGGGEDPGIVFADAVFDRVRTCPCKCVFCFVEQLPEGLRPPLYLRDDDFRLSFLNGNFITLNNLRDEDLERIVTQRLSPLHVSVHSTDAALRARMMGCPEKTAARGLANLRRLGEARIETHAQLVLCPGMNDGEALDRTVEELARDYPGVASAGAVPVAVDPAFAARGGLRGFTDEECAAVAGQVERWQSRFRKERGNGFVYAADEFYLRAGLALPTAGDYDGFPQYENGIGIAASFRDEAEGVARGILETLEREDRPARAGASIFLLTGELAAGLVAEACRELGGRLGADLRPLVAANRLFGPYVTVTGLLGGEDILSAATGAGIGPDDVLVVPARCLESSGELFLDGVTLAGLEERLGCRVLVV
ncbi:MAG: DUF512 domain-containing protein [Pseudomonadota bacterium]